MQQTIKKLRFPLLIISGIISALPLIFSWLGFVGWVSLIPAAYVFIKLAKDKEIKLARIYLFVLIGIHTVKRPATGTANACIFYNERIVV